MNIKDYPFNPKFSDVEMEAAKKFLSEKASFSETVNFAVIVDGGGTLSHRGSGCHGRIGSYDSRGLHKGSRCLVATENGWARSYHNSKTPVDVAEPFLRWFLYESFASRFILNKDDFEFCRDHGFIFSADMDCSLLINCLIVTRHFFEVPKEAFKLFTELSEVVPGAVAYSLAFNTGLSCGNGYSTTNIYTHRAWPIWPTMASLENFVNGEFTDNLKDDPKKHFRNFSTLYGGATYCTHLKLTSPMYVDSGSFIRELVDGNKEYKQALSEFRKDKVGNKIVNPFLRNTGLQDTQRQSQPWLHSLEETKEVLVPHLATLFNENCSIKSEETQPVKEIILV